MRVQQRPDGSGWYIPNDTRGKTYKTKRGAEQAKRMLQHPELWKNNLFYQYTHSVDTYIDEVSEMTYDEMDWLSEAGLTSDDINWILEEEEENYEWDDDNFDNPVIYYRDLPYYFKRKISKMRSESKCVERFNSNGWSWIYLSDLIEDFGRDIVDMFLVV